MSKRVSVTSDSRPEQRDASDNYIESVDRATGNYYVAVHLRYEHKREQWRRFFSPDGSLLCHLTWQPSKGTFRVEEGSVAAVHAAQPGRLNNVPIEEAA